MSTKEQSHAPPVTKPAPAPGADSKVRPRFRGIGLATKMVATIALIVGLVAFVMTTRATSQLETSLTHSFESKGEAIALSLAAAAERSVGTQLTTVQGSIDSNKAIEDVKYIYIVDRWGRVVVHTFHPVFPEGFQNTNVIGLGEVLEDGKRVRIADVSYDTPEHGMQRGIDVAAPVAGGALGTVHVGMDPDAIAARAADLRSQLLTWGGVIALIGIGVALIVLMYSVIRPVEELRRVTAEIIRSGDLTQQIRVRSNDEIGQLATMFAQMVQKLREIPNGLSESTQMLGSAVEHLTSSSNEQSASINRQAAALQEAQATVEEIKQTSLLAAQKAEAVLEVAKRADEISRSGEQAIVESLSGLTSIRSQVSQIAQKIADLTDRTRQIGLITETVKGLADQSNMLALNAAIEAVRSGEHGKGFAVVAREIRSLADQSIQATGRVREILEDISGAIQQAVVITETGAANMEDGLSQVKVSGDKLRELSGIVKDNASAVRQIAAAVNQQNAGIAQIFGAVTELNEQMNETVTRLSENTKNVEGLRDVSFRVSEVVGSFRV